MRKFSILKHLVVCLSCLIIADKADDLLYHETDSGRSTVSLFAPAESDSVDNETYSFTAPETQCRIPRQTNISNSLRTFAQAKRPGNLNTARHGFTMAKPGKSMNQYTTSLFFVSILNFPSGLTEPNHHLISLGKLII